MAKNASRNLVQLKRDNRYSHLPVLCSIGKCENEALVIKGPHSSRKKYCEDHYNAHCLTSSIASNKVLQDVSFFKSLGIL